MQCNKLLRRLLQYHTQTHLDDLEPLAELPDRLLQFYMYIRRRDELRIVERTNRGAAGPLWRRCWWRRLDGEREGAGHGAGEGSREVEGARVPSIGSRCEWSRHWTAVVAAK